MKNGVKTADGSLQELRQNAGLPTRLRVWFDDAALTLPAPWQADGAGQWFCDCAEGEKTALLGALWQAGTPRNIDMLPPALDDLYAHFLRREDATA